ncbi:MAG: endonuclease/exonuclease/phosphatase family protein [Myxococcota bacterium]
MSTFRHSRRRLVLALSVAAPLTAASVLALGARWSTTLDLLTHFRAQYFLGFVLLAGYLLWARAYHLALGALAMVTLNGYWLAPLFVTDGVTLHAASDPIVVMSANVLHRGGDPRRTSETIARVKPDVVAELKGGLLLIATHPIPPIGPDETLARNAQLVELGKKAAESERPVLLVGDLNTTPFSPSFSDLLRHGGFRDSARGHGYAPTWPTFFLPLSIPIDHALHSSNVEIVDRRVGPNIGSDHYPLVVTVRYETEQILSR